jgi:hypothetical protein
MTRVIERMGMVLLDASRRGLCTGPATPVAKAPGWVFGINEALERIRHSDAGSYQALGGLATGRVSSSQRR